MIKLIAIDMDGTLLNDEKQIPDGFQKWVLNHKNIKIIIASGRQYPTLRDNMGNIADHFFYIAENGAVTYANDKLIHCDVIDKGEVQNVLMKIKDVDNITPILCCADTAITEPLTPLLVKQCKAYYHSNKTVDNLLDSASNFDVCKIALYCADKSAEKIFNQLNFESKTTKTTLSGNDWIDIANIGVNKGKGLKKIQEILNVLSDECMAFGDYLNDIELLQSCTHSYAMQNAHPKLKLVAAHIAASNNDSGVMQVLEKF